MGHCGGALGVREKCGRCMCSFELWTRCIYNISRAIGFFVGL